MTHCPPSPPVPFQIAAEGRGTPPCKPGFSEDTYKVVLPDMIEKGRPLFNGEWHRLSARYACVWHVYQMPQCLTSGGGSEQPRRI